MKIMVSCFALVMTIGVAVLAQEAAPAIQVKPDRVLMDEAVSIRLSGLQPDQPVTLKATMTTPAGAVWQSRAVFVADKKGAVDVGKQPSTEGSYTGVDPMGLFWSMTATGERKQATNSPRPYMEPIAVQLDAEVAGKMVASATLTRLAVAPGVRSYDVKDNGLVARFYEPEKGGPHPCILVMGGSEGGIRTAEMRAGILASRGYAALAVAYFGMEGLPKNLVEVPVDYLKKAVDWMTARETVDRNRLAVLGGSKGGELALLLASRFPELKAVVAYVPSHVVWESIPGGNSSWSYQGKPLPYVPYKPVSQPDPTKPLDIGALYLASLDNKEAVTKAAIEVEKINGPVLVLSGKDDKLWPSSLMADAVIARLKEKKHPHRYEHLAYESAGHAVGVPYRVTTDSMGSPRFQLGGSPAANARAQADSWPKVLQFLKESLRKARR